MSTAHKKVAKELTDELKRHGIRDYRVDDSRRHPRLIFTHKGREHSMVFSGTPSDWRAGKNNLAELQRILGPAKSAKATRPARRGRRTAARPALECPTLTERPDPWAPLAALASAESPA